MSQENRSVGRVTVDRTRCFSHERCVLVAPQVFSIDDEGISVPGDIEQASDAMLLHAAEACPVQAIFVFDREGTQIFPERVNW